MKVIPSSLSVVIQQFPEQQEKLETLFCQVESFRSLCEDFSDCKRAMEYWCEPMSSKEHASARYEEYRDLFEDLKSEITDLLADVTDDVPQEHSH
jgi:putative ribosome biogenesis GTPase RsgA